MNVLVRGREDVRQAPEQSSTSTGEAHGGERGHRREERHRIIADKNHPNPLKSYRFPRIVPWEHSVVEVP
jgi:hypothetical protein